MKTLDIYSGVFFIKNNKTLVLLNKVWYYDFDVLENLGKYNIGYATGKLCFLRCRKGGKINPNIVFRCHTI